jgi:hypothetical protein
VVSTTCGKKQKWADTVRPYGLIYKYTLCVRGVLCGDLIQMS